MNEEKIYCPRCRQISKDITISEGFRKGIFDKISCPRCGTFYLVKELPILKKDTPIFTCESCKLEFIESEKQKDNLCYYCTKTKKF